MIDNKTSACLIENNIFYRLHTSILLRSGSSGNVIAYNYSAGNYHDPQTSWLIQDMDANHGAHPMMNLYEGNIAGLFQPDSFWGSSSHCTVLRNWFLGDDIVFPPYSTRGAYQTNSSFHVSANLMAVDLNYAISYHNLVGNIVGCTYGMNHDVYQAKEPASEGGSTLYLYSTAMTKTASHNWIVCCPIILVLMLAIMTR